MGSEKKKKSSREALPFLCDIVKLICVEEKDLERWDPFLLFVLEHPLRHAICSMENFVSTLRDSEWFGLIIYIEVYFWKKWLAGVSISTIFFAFPPLCRRKKRKSSGSLSWRFFSSNHHDLPSETLDKNGRKGGVAKKKLCNVELPHSKRAVMWRR